jgi:hypothetical protein
MENTANLGLFAVYIIVSEYTKKIYAYMEKTPRDTKLRISWLVMVRHEIVLDSYFLYKMGRIKPKNHFTLYCPFNRSQNLNSTTTTSRQRQINLRRSTDQQLCQSTNSLSNMSNSRRFWPAELEIRC